MGEDSRILITRCGSQLTENRSGENLSPHRLAVQDYALSRRQHRFKSGWGYDGQLFEVATPAKLGCGVIGNTADSGSAILGSSPGIPANDPRRCEGFLFSNSMRFSGSKVVSGFMVAKCAFRGVPLT